MGEGRSSAGSRGQKAPEIDELPGREEWWRNQRTENKDRRVKRIEAQECSHSDLATPLLKSLQWLPFSIAWPKILSLYSRPYNHQATTHLKNLRFSWLFSSCAKDSNQSKRTSLLCVSVPALPLFITQWGMDTNASDGWKKYRVDKKKCPLWGATRRQTTRHSDVSYTEGKPGS